MIGISYSIDLRLFASWCTGNGVSLLQVKRAHVEVSAATWNPRV